MGLYGLDPGQGFPFGVVGQEDGVGLGQLDVCDLDYRLALGLVPAGGDLDALAEGLVVAAPCALVGQLVDGGDVLGQLQGAAEVGLVDFEAVLGFCEGRFGGGDLVLHPGALGAERVGGGAVALFGVELDEPLLLEFEAGDQLCLGFADVEEGLLADLDHRADRFLAAFGLGGGDLDRSFAVHPLDRGLDQVGADVDALSARGAVDAAGAEEVGVPATVFAGAYAVGQAAAAPSAEHRAA